MGTSTSTAGKGGTTTSGTGNPAWATVGTPEYNQINSLFQTAPLAVANQTFAQGGVGSAGQNAINQLTQGGGSNDWMNTAAMYAANPGQVDTSYFNTVYNKAGQPGAADQYLTGTAQGQYLNGSPYLDEIISKGAGDIATQTNQMFAAGGRYGSGANQGVLSDSIGSMANELRNANYQAERDRQIGAANSLEAAQQGRLGLQSGAASGMAGAQGQNTANYLTGASQLGALGQNKFNNLTAAAGLENTGFQNMLGMLGQLPNIQTNKTYDALQQMMVGGQFDETAQAQLNDLINQWSQTDMQDWSALGGLLSAGLGSAGSYGTQTSTTESPANILGALGSLFTAFGGL